jgi:acetoin utilization protein AcuB
MKIGEIMTAPVLTVGAGEPASDAIAWMRDANVRHVPVVAGTEVIGVASERDLGGPHGGATRKGHTVGDLMHRDPVLASPDLDVRAAAAMVRERRIGCLPVVEEGRLVGIVTRSDLLEALAHLRRRDRALVRSKMAEVPRPPLVVSPNRDKWP